MSKTLRQKICGLRYMIRKSSSVKVSEFLVRELDCGEQELINVTKKVSFDMNKHPKQLNFSELQELIEAVDWI